MTPDPIIVRFVRKTLRAFVATALVVSLCSLTYANGPAVANEYQLKAAFIYNLLSFVEWPASANSDRLTIGIAGDTPLGPTLIAYVDGKHLGRRSIQVREVHSRSEMRACDLLVVGYSDSSRAREVLTHLRDSNVLSVGDGDAFANSGGVIAFVAHDNKLQLAVNPKAAERANVRLSAKLLSIARIVPDGDPGR